MKVHLDNKEIIQTSLMDDWTTEQLDDHDKVYQRETKTYELYKDIKVVAHGKRKLNATVIKIEQ